MSTHVWDVRCRKAPPRERRMPIRLEIELNPSFRWGQVQHPPLAVMGRWGQDYHNHLLLRDSDGSLRELYSDDRSSVNCPLAWAPGGDWVYHAHGNRLLAIHRASREVTPIWTGGRFEYIHWNLESCQRTGRVYFQAGAEIERLIMCEPEGRERTILRGKFFTSHASLKAGYALFFQDCQLNRVCLESGRVNQVLPSAPHHFAVGPNGRMALCNGSVQIRDPEPKNLENHELQGCCPAWSPDGQLLAVMEGDHSLWLIDPWAGTAPLALAKVKTEVFSIAERNGSYASRPVWSSDSRYLTTSLTCTERVPDPPTARPGLFGENFRFEHASILFSLRERVAEVWPGYYTNEAFRPSL